MPQDQYIDTQKLTVRPATGGMVSSLPVQDLELGEFKVLHNAYFYKNRWRTRPGVAPIRNSGAGGYGAGAANTLLLGPIIGLFRLERSDGQIYTVVIDFESANGSPDNARLLYRKLETGVGEIATAVDWTVADGSFEIYSLATEPHFWSGIQMLERLILTDGLTTPKYFAGLDTDLTTVLKGNLGAFPPQRQPTKYDLQIGLNPIYALWQDNPIAKSGYFQYCYRYVYQDKSGQASYSNPSPRSQVYALDWFGKYPDGKLPNFFVHPVQVDASISDVGPSAIGVENIGIGTEFMSSATDIDPVRRIVRREVFRRSKSYADLPFSPWEKVADIQIADGNGTTRLIDKQSEPTPLELTFDLNTPPNANYIALHKERAFLMNIGGRTLPSPYNQSDVTYPMYALLGMSKRARIAITNNTDHGLTDAVVRFKLQWHTAANQDYIDFDDSPANAERRILFTDDDGVTLLGFYREDYQVAVADEAIFLVRIPEILPKGTAFIYVYYNTSGAISDYSSRDNTYHRRYLASDMVQVFDMDNDYPIDYDDSPVPIGRALQRAIKHGGAFSSTQGAPLGNDPAVFQSVGYSWYISGSDQFLDLFESLIPGQGRMGDTNEGCVQFFFKTVAGDPDGAGLDLYILIGGGINLRYNTGTLSVNIGGSVVNLNMTLEGDSCYFISIGWDANDASDVHLYCRKIGSL